MTYNVFGRKLSLTQSISFLILHKMQWRLGLCPESRWKAAFT